MKKLAILTICIIVACSASAFAQKVASVDRHADVPSFIGYVPDEFVLVMNDGAGKLNPTAAANGLIVTGIPDFDAISAKFNISGIKKQFEGSSEAVKSATSKLSRYYKIRFDAGDLQDVMDAFSKHPMVDHVEPIGIHTTYAMPNDGWFGDQWHLHQTNDHDIDAPEAWDLEAGADALVVAILDTGVRYFHKDLGGLNASYSNPTAVDGNMWVNWTEKNGTAGVDDDGNGYIDDWIGYDFVDGGSNCWSGEDCYTKDNDPRDFNGHGTHCAGNVAAITNNGYATCGVAGGWGDGTLQPSGNGVKVMACRIGWSGTYGPWEVGYVRMDFAAEAFYYAADNGASIVSCSWGSSNSGGIAAAIDYFLTSGGLVFHAAGNDGSQTADYLGSRTDVINVAATDQLDCKADYSTYGTWVDISAPGTEVWSSYHDHNDPESDYVAPIDGTSMASPMAAGVAALIWSKHPDWTAAQVEQRLYDTADDIYAEACNSSYAGKLGAGRINAFNAVNEGTPPPVADFSGSPTSGCAPLEVSFTDLSTGEITSWSWTYGDGGSSTDQNPVYTYLNAGTYTVSLTVTGPGGSDTETKTSYIIVQGVPIADFSGSPTNGDAPLTVDFTDLSTGSPATWSWNFGDGVGTSTQQNPSYTYTTAGTYTVTMTASNTCGSDVATKVDYITVTTPPPPVADFVGLPTSGSYPLTVDFTDQSTGNPTTWSWDFGDGVGTSALQNPSYTYGAIGTYTVTLTVTNSQGSDTEIKPDYIDVTEPHGPSKAYALSDIPVVGTVSGSNIDTRTSDNVYEVITEVLYTGHPRKRYSYLEHKWDFSVGSSGGAVTFYVEAYRPSNSDGDNFIFEYSTDGVTYLSLVTVASATEQTYLASLPDGTNGTVYVRVMDSNRNWDMISLDPIYIDYMYIEFTSEPVPPVAAFIGLPTLGSYPLTVDFIDQSTGDPTTWSWDFGDGIGTSTVQNPSYIYNAVGVYTVSLTVTNAQGSDNETKYDYITVTEPGQNTMHVHDVVVGRAKVGPSYKGTCTVTIYNQDNNSLANATVYVIATGPTGGNFSGLTGADGTVYFETSLFKKPVGEWCFEVTDVTHGVNTYEPASNNVTKACESGWVYRVAGDMADDKITPDGFMLTQNYPNPFNPVTEISFYLSSDSYARLDIFNLLGQRVTTLVDRHLQAGEHSFTWDAADQASGMYFYKLQTDMAVEIRKMMLLK